MSHGSHALTTPTEHTLNPISTNPPPHNDSPSSELISELKGLLDRHNKPNASPEAFHELLSLSLARVLEQPTLHWWCHQDLRPIAIELLHIFSLDANSSLEHFKDTLENVLSSCLDCTESYQQDRRVYLSRLLKQYDKDVVDIYFSSLLGWDCSRLEKRLQDLLTAPASPEILKRRKICVCEILLDPTLLLDLKYSGRIADPLTALLNQMLSNKKMKIMSVLPGTWLLMLHRDPPIQSWAVFTSNLASTHDSLVPERWIGWEQFPGIWEMALEISNGSQAIAKKTNIPLSNDPVRVWRAIRTMVSNMGRDVIRLSMEANEDNWKTLHAQLLRSIQDPTTPSAVFLETCRLTFHLLGNLKQDFWMVNGQHALKDLSEAEQILQSIFQHNGTMEYISALVAKEQVTKDVATTQVLLRAYAEHTAWISAFINSLSTKFELFNVIVSTASCLLDVISKRIARRVTDPTIDVDQESNSVYLEYDLEILNVVFQLLGEKHSEAILVSVAEVLSNHWEWLAPICALGSSALDLSALATHTAQRIKGLAARASASSRKIALALLDQETEIMWRNYNTATATAKAEEVGKLDKVYPVIWLRLSQTSSRISSQNVQRQLDSEKQEQLMEWQTCMVEQLSKLALLPKLETKTHFSKDALRMCASFNDDLDVVFRANAILLQGLGTLGYEWLKKTINGDSKRFLVKLLKLWCSPDSETRTQALFIMRTAWHEVARPSCLRLAYQIGGEKSIEELDNILADFRNRGSPGGAAPAALFELVLDSVTTLFLNNPIDGEGGLYLQIFLDLTSSQDVAQHLSLIKNLWNSIWLSVRAAFVAGRTIWADRQDRSETIRTMKLVANVGLLIIGKIRYFERLLEFERQDQDGDILDQELDDLGVPKPSSLKETMPLDAMRDALPRVADWTYAQDETLCTSAIELVCAVLDLLAEHENTIPESTITYLSAIAEGNPKVKSLLTLEQREMLWIVLSRHVAYPGGAMRPSLQNEQAEPEAKVPSKSQPIEISDDDFGDLDDIDLSEVDLEDTPRSQSGSSAQKVQTSITSFTSGFSTAASTSRPDTHRTTSNGSYQSKLNFSSTGPVGGIPAGGSSVRKLPATLNRFNLNITSKSVAKPAAKAVPVKKGNKLSQMRADHQRERSNIAAASKAAREIARHHPVRPTTSNANVVQLSESESDSGSDSDDMGRGLSSLVDAEEKWNNRNKVQEPRKTKLLELDQVTAPNKFMDTVALRRQKAFEDAQRQHRLTPNLAALHAQILKWDVASAGDRPPDAKDYASIPSTFRSVDDYIRAFEPLLILECWQQLMSAREEVSQSSDSVFASFVNRVSIDTYQDIHMKIPLDKASSLMVEDIVVISDPHVKDVFTATGNAARAKPFFAKVQSITRTKGECEVIFRTYLKIVDSSPLMFMRPQTTWSVLKMLNMTTTHREYAALTAMRYYELCNDILNPPDTPSQRPSLENVQKVMDIYKVNTPQAQAIVGAIEKPNGFTLIQGPPGTGKTKTILGLVGALLADTTQTKAPTVQSSKVSQRPLQMGTVNRILVCAPSNAAIDEIVKRLMNGIRNTSGEIFTPKVVRVGTLDTIGADVKEVALDTLIAKELESSSTSKDEFQSAAQTIASMREKMRQLQQDLEKARLGLVQAKEVDDPMAIANAQSKVKAINKSKWQLGQELDSARTSSAEASQKRDQARKDARNKILGEADVICSTLSASGHELLTTSAFTFETVIIDEAAQSVEISSLIPLKYRCKRCILVGDPNQLPPTVISQLATKYAYNQSLFVRIQSRAPASVHLLSIQYRMHPDISAFPSREFYKGLLKDGPEMAKKTRAEWHKDLLSSPYRFFDVYEGREQTGLSHSQHNPVEAEAAAKLLEWLCNSNPSSNFFRRVGVISPYKQQVRTLREYFQRIFDKGILEAVDFNTVDGFQGQEKDIIIFSCVRASSSGSVGFLADIRRMNVALTRARQSLFILGHADTLRREEIWGDLVRDAESRKLFTSVTPGLFGQRRYGVPTNILQHKAGADRKNDPYGRTVDQKMGTAIERPMATIDDIMEAAFYPTLPEVSSNANQTSSLMARNSTRQPEKRESTSQQHRSGRDSSSTSIRRVEHSLPSRPSRVPSTDDEPRQPNSRSEPRPLTISTKRRQEDSLTSDLSLADQSADASSPVRGRESSPTTPGGTRHPLPARPPSPKRSKTTPSLFLKSKPMSMKSAGPSKQYDIPTRDRLASQVIPIRKSYPSAPNRPASLPKRPSGPSLDDLLDTMKKPRGP